MASEVGFLVWRKWHELYWPFDFQVLGDVTGTKTEQSAVCPHIVLIDLQRRIGQNNRWPRPVMYSKVCRCDVNGHTTNHERH